MNKSDLIWLQRKILASIRYIRSDGFISFASLFVRRLKTIPNIAQTNVFDFYAFTNNPLSVKTPHAIVANKNTLNWYIPPCGKGSGGHLNIFRFVSFLERQGFICRIVIVGEPKPISVTQARKEINEWYFPIKAEVYMGKEDIPAAHTSIATSWTTAYYVNNTCNTTNKVYFVQDYEPYFYPLGSDYVLAEQTYHFDFYGITAGRWLKEKLEKDYHMKTSFFSFSYDKDIYKPKAKKPSKEINVFFYARPPTARRGFEVGLMALKEITDRMPEINIILAGWDTSNYLIPFKHKSVGTLPVDLLPELYSQCDVALVLSFTNLSLLPLELMACGVPIVGNKGENVEWLLNEANSILTKPTPKALADALFRVLTEKGCANRLREGGLATAEASDWEEEAIKVGKVLRNL